MAELKLIENSEKFIDYQLVGISSDGFKVRSRQSDQTRHISLLYLDQSSSFSYIQSIDNLGSPTPLIRTLEIPLVLSGIQRSREKAPSLLKIKAT